jgi:hypothetical protein
MASQIRLWERKVKEGLATLSSTSPPTQRQLHVAITPLTVDVSDTTPANEAASTASQIRPWERDEGWPGNAFLYLYSHTTTATRSHHPLDRRRL